MTKLTPEQIGRYKRQILVPEIGVQGQTELGTKHVAIIGAGALGGVVAKYLCASGIGHLTIFDDDFVDLSNLQRQIQFSSADIGKSKAEILGANLSEINPNVSVKPKVGRFTAQTFVECDLFIDASDNFGTRFAINDLSLQTATPMLSGAVGRWEGQIGLFNDRDTSPCYRCWIAEAPYDYANCEDDGVVGPVCGIVSSILALEAIKILTHMRDTISGQIIVISGLKFDVRALKLSADPTCVFCQKK